MYPAREEQQLASGRPARKASGAGSVVRDVWPGKNAVALPG